MSLKRSPTFTALLPDVSAGASPSGYIKRWNRDLPELAGDTGTSLWESVHDGSGLRFKLELTRSATDSAQVWTYDSTLRVFCHMLIERLPSEAIPEVAEAAQNAWMWYSRPSLSAPSPSAAQYMIPGPERLLPPVKAPEFRFEEE